MSIDGLSGGPGPILPQAASAVTGALGRLLEVGPVDARVTALLNDGGVRVSTAFGALVLASEVPLQLGERVRLRLDAVSGQVKAEPLQPRAILAAAGPETAAGPLAALAGGEAKASQGGLSAALSSAILAGLAPVGPGSAAVVAAAPQADALLYSLLATLFPAAAADGRLRRPRHRRSAVARAYGDVTHDEPEPTEPTEPPPDAGPNEPGRAVWIDIPVAPPLDGEPTEDLPGSRARIELVLAGAGRVRLDAHLTGGSIRVEVRSEATLPEELRDRIRAEAETLAQGWDAPLDLHWMEDPAAFA